MTGKGSDGASRKSRVLRVVLFVVAALVLFYITSCIRIVRQAARDEARPADAIIVLGAAEYAGRPSPVFRARLDHAYELFDRKLAPVVIISGGSGKDPTFTEGGVGRDYLITRGIGDQHLIAETQGDNTAESAERVGVIMRANGWTSCVAVSDAYHLFRIKKMMARQGIRAYVSPRPQEKALTKTARLLTVMREALSYMMWSMHVT